MSLFWASMPKTTIHEDHHPLLWKSEVRPAKNRKVSSPASYFVLSKQASQRDFGILVAAPTNPGHHLRPLRFGKHISHFSHRLTQLATTKQNEGGMDTDSLR